MIRKQVLLDEKTVEVFNALKKQCPLVSDTVILRAGLLAASALEQAEFVTLCEEAYVPVGKPKSKEK